MLLRYSKEFGPHWLHRLATTNCQDTTSNETNWVGTCQKWKSGWAFFGVVSTWSKSVTVKIEAVTENPVYEGGGGGVTVQVEGVFYGEMGKNLCLNVLQLFS